MTMISLRCSSIEINLFLPKISQIRPLLEGDSTWCCSRLVSHEPNRLRTVAEPFQARPVGKGVTKQSLLTCIPEQATAIWRQNKKR